MKKLQGAIVGLGYWGPNLVRNFLKIHNVKIKIVCDISQQTIRNFKKEYPDISVTSDYQKILTDPEIDFIALATPLNTHFILAKQALLSGKHVLVEKPMTQTSNEATILIDLATKQKKLLMVGHTFIFTDAVQEMKKIITNKKFGELMYFDSTRINLGRLQKDTNVIWDLAPHDLSILNYLFTDSPIKVQASGSSYITKNNIEIAHIFLTYKNNITAHIHVSWLSPIKMRTILIGGSKQMIQYNDIEPSEKIRIYNKSIVLDPKGVTPFAPAYRSGSVLIPQIKQYEALYSQLSHFIQCIQTGKKSLTNMHEGAKVVKLLEAIDQAIKKNTEIRL